MHDFPAREPDWLSDKRLFALIYYTLHCIAYAIRYIRPNNVLQIGARATGTKFVKTCL